VVATAAEEAAVVATVAEEAAAVMAAAEVAVATAAEEAAAVTIKIINFFLLISDFEILFIFSEKDFFYSKRINISIFYLVIKKRMTSTAILFLLKLLSNSIS
jgi:hypothetical protein